MLLGAARPHFVLLGAARPHLVLLLGLLYEGPDGLPVLYSAAELSAAAKVTGHAAAAAKQ